MASPLRTRLAGLVCAGSIALLAGTATLSLLSWSAPLPEGHLSPIVVLVFVPAVAGMPVLGTCWLRVGPITPTARCGWRAGAGYALCWFAVAYALYDAGPGTLPAAPLV